MRISRSLQLSESSGKAHMYSRCHNKEYYLNPPSMKALYLQAVKEGLKEKVSFNKVKLYCYCIMGNHMHSEVGYEESSEYLSRFMRHSNSLFGSRYNRRHNRSGKVSESRPKTSLIQNVEHEMRVQFYIDANPIRANICTPENLRFYKYSSFKFYAYGIEDEFTSLLTIPDWYIDLGDTPKLRQKRYRKLFYAYLKEDMPKQEAPIYQQPFLGSQLWVLQQKNRITVFLKKKKTDSS